MKGLSAVFVLFIILISCATQNPEPIEETTIVEPVVSPEAKLLEGVLLDVTICSPSSLKNAFQVLEGTEVGESEYGQELMYLAVTLADILYPEIAKNLPSIPPPPAVIYPDLFEEIRAGNFPVVPQESVSFLTLIIPPMACLYNSSPDLLERCSEALLQAVSLETRSVLPPYLLGVIREKQENWQEAMTYYDRALRTDDSCYPADIGWVRSALKTDMVSQALTRLDVLIEQFPEKPDLRYLQSKGYLLQGDLSGALEYITDALWAEPENPSYLLLRARILETQGSLDQAWRILLIVETKVPENEEIVYLRSRILYGKEDYNRAAEELEQALQTYPGSKQFTELYGEVLIAAGRSDEARAYLEEELERDPNNERNLELLAKDARDAGEWEAAAGYIERLLEIESRDRYLWLAADIYRTLDQWDKTLLFTETLYENNYGGSETVLLYLESLIRNDQTDKAKRIAEETLTVETDSGVRSELYYHLSRVLTDRNERLDALRSALLEDLHNINALIALADFYVETGDYRKAYRYINQAYMLDPENLFIRTELRRIEELAK